MWLSCLLTIVFDCRFVLEGGERESHHNNKRHHRSPWTNVLIINKAIDPLHRVSMPAAIM